MGGGSWRFLLLWGFFYKFIRLKKCETVIAFLPSSEIAASRHSPCLFSIHKFAPFWVEPGGIMHASGKDDKYYLTKDYLKQDEKFPIDFM